MIKIIINGAFGKMGRTTVAAIANEKDLALVATLGRDDDLSQAIKKFQADVVIDWTVPTTAFENTKKIIDAGARPVIGTTGFTLEQIKLLSQECESKKIGCIIAPNFSIGAILMMKYAKDAAKYFPNVEIVEYHHPTKLDAPSGTAKKTAELIAKTIPIHSVRLPGIFAEQDVVFAGLGERLIIRHAATDRNAMMPGLFLCCRKVMALNGLTYGMETLI
ncbi:MAG: 4-hydroxy-tetrahydrodipicolinate reductase [Gammaproteobacteria bacterium]|nr:4-hydroxy-tetrahydrodipicolinate reductase [Gammaproteobacteria bacterium]